MLLEIIGTAIVVSYIFSFSGSFIAVCLGEQYRQCLISHTQLVGANSLLWLMALAIGGVAIWSMHFIGMGAMVFKDSETHTIIPVKFDFILTVVSFIVGVVFVYIGLYIATYDRVFIRNHEEFDKMMISDASRLTIKELRNKRKIQFFVLDS